MALWRCSTEACCGVAEEETTKNPFVMILASEKIQLENQGATADMHVDSLLICIHCKSAWEKEVVTKFIKK